MSTTIRIHDIQGATHRSPLAGQTVSDVPGIVTAVRSNGFYLQDPSPDANDATSEGIFVFTGSGAKPRVGDSVQVNGVVGEFRPGNPPDSNSLTITQIGGAGSPAAAFTILSGGNPLPDATVIGNGGRIPPNQVISDDAAGGNVENAGTVFDPENDGIDFYESLEGVRVQVNNATVVAPTNQFGEVFVLADNGAGATGVNSRGGITISADDFNPERIQIDRTLLSSRTPATNVGDKLGTVTGVIDYSFNNYELLTTAPLSVTPGNLAKETTNLTSSSDQLTVATFNVENLDPKLEDINKVSGNTLSQRQSNVDDDIGDGKFVALAGQIVNNLKSPDIIALQEVQDNDGAELTDVVDASLTYQTLIDAITVAGGSQYKFADIPPVDDQNGGQPGGNIRVGFLYKDERVDIVSATLIDPTNPAFNESRKPLAGKFLFNSNEVTVIANHFNSKGGDQPLFGPNQPPTLTSEPQRIQQAQIVNDYVDSLLEADPSANIIVAGDLNDFQFSKPLNVLKGTPDGAGTPVLTDLAEVLLPANEQYTYNFQGNSQVLDHILVSNNLRASNAEVDIAHINSEFTDQTSDHDPTVARFTLPTKASVLPTVETPPVLDTDERPGGEPLGDADDPAIYVHPTDASQSLVIGSLKDGGLQVYDLKGQVLQSIAPEDIRYNNVDLLYGFNLGGEQTDLAIASDRRNDTLAIFKIDPNTRQLTDITSDSITESIFAVDDGEQTAYGLAAYRSPVSGESYIFVSQREGDRIAQLKLADDGTGGVKAELVRTFTVPIPEGGELEDAQVEGMVADRELGYLYLAQENVGIWKFSAEPDGDTTGELIDQVFPNGSNLKADAEGLTIYYADNGKGYLLASSQGDSTFAVYTREGDNAYLGNFRVGESGGIDSVQNSDGADVINVSLGSDFPFGLLVTHDGSNDSEVLVEDDGELENVSTNFKFVPWQNVADAFSEQLAVNTTSFNPRNPSPTSETLVGTEGDDRLNGLGGNDTVAGDLGDDVIFGGDGEDVLRGDLNNRSPGGNVGGDDIIYGGTGNDHIGGKGGNDKLYGDEGNDQLWGDDGDDLLRGGLGNDRLVGDDFSGGSGRDTFVLAQGEGTDTIEDFQIGEDFIGLAGGFTFGQLSIAQDANNTLISVSDQTLAILTAVNASTLTETAFTII